MIGQPIKVREVSRNRAIVAYRVFTISPYSERLDGNFMSFDYKRTQNVAKGTPGRRNERGFHAYKSPTRRSRDFSNRSIRATVALYGRVVEHQGGYRASHMVIKRLTCIYRANTYLGVRARTAAARIGMKISRFGSLVPAL